MKVILIHGYATREIREDIRKIFGPDEKLFIKKVFDTGYVFSVAASRQIADVRARRLVDAIYRNEDLIPELRKRGDISPIFTGILPEGIPINDFTFLGGIWGFDKEGIGLYEE